MKYESKSHMDTISLVKKILDEKNFSKYALAKKMQVSWSTIHFWYKGIWKPNKRNLEKLRGIYYETDKGQAQPAN